MSLRKASRFTNQASKAHRNFERKCESKVLMVIDKKIV